MIGWYRKLRDYINHKPKYIPSTISNRELLDFTYSKHPFMSHNLHFRTLLTPYSDITAPKEPKSATYSVSKTQNGRAGA